MKNALKAALALAVRGGCRTTVAHERNRSMLTSVVVSLSMLSPNVAAQSDPPIACTPKALDATQRLRQTELLGIVRGKTLKTVELTNGYAIQLPNDSAMAVQAAEWASLERRCCGFAEFAIELRLDSTLWVKVTGGEGVKEVLALEMGFQTKK